MDFDDINNLDDVDHLSSLPAPILRIIIVKHLSWGDLASLFRCNRKLSKLADDEELWRGVYAATQTNDSFEAVVESFLEQLDVSSFWKDTCRSARFEGPREALLMPPRHFYLSETRTFLEDYLTKANIDIVILGDCKDAKTSFLRCLESQIHHTCDDDITLRCDGYRATADLLSRASAFRGNATLASFETRAVAERIAGPICSPLPVIVHHGYSASDLIVHAMHRRGCVLIFCFDINDAQSFSSLQENLITEFNLQPTDADVHCWILVGLAQISLPRVSQQNVSSPRSEFDRMRSVIAQQPRAVSLDEAKSLASAYDMPYLEISCSTAPTALSLAAFEFAVKRPRQTVRRAQQNLNNLNISNNTSGSSISVIRNYRSEAADALQQFVKIRDGLVRLLAGVSAPVPNLKNVAAESRATVAEMKVFYRAHRGRLQDYADRLKQCARELIATVKSALMCRAPAKLGAPGGVEELSSAITKLAHCMNEIRLISLKVICANAVL